MSAVLELCGVTKSYGDNQVLRGIDLQVGEHYEVSAEDTSFNPGAPAAANVVALAPRTVLSKSSWKGRVITMRFRADGATSMRAYSTGRQIARAKGARLTVRLRMPPRATRRTVRVVASSPAGSSARTWTVRSRPPRRPAT